MKKGTCVNFSGTINSACNAGINYEMLVGNSDMGWATHLPCFTFEPGIDKVSCSLYQEPTDKELADFDQEIENELKRFNQAMPLILALKREYKKRSGQVVRVCPICGGVLHMSISGYNGHVWGKCETEKCLSWVE